MKQSVIQHSLSPPRHETYCRLAGLWLGLLCCTALVAQEASDGAPAPKRPVVLDHQPDAWGFAVPTPELGELTRRGPEGQVLRVAPANSVDRPWHSVALSRNLPIETGKHYRLRLQARADAPRSIMASVSQSQPPFKPIGLIEEVQLTAKWQTLHLDFTAIETTETANMLLGMGGSDGPVEFGRIEVFRIPSHVRQEWVVVALEGATAKLDFPLEAAGLMRLTVPKQPAKPWDVQWIRGGIDAKLGEQYALLARTRSARPFRGDAALVASDYSTQLSKRQFIGADAKWKWQRLEFGASANSAGAHLTFNAGSHEGLLELADASIEVVPWHMNLGGGAVAEIVPSGDPLATRVAIATKGANQYDVSLESRGYAVDAGDLCKVTFKAKADENRTALLMLQSRDAATNWQNVGCLYPVGLTTDWQSYKYEFVVQSSADLARFYFQVGGNDVPVEVSDFAVEGMHDARDGKTAKPEDKDDTEADARWTPAPLDDSRPGQWHVKAEPPQAAQGWRSASDEQLLRVRAVREASDGSQVTALHPLPTLRYHEAYVLEYQARCQRPRLVRVALAKAGQPVHELGLSASDRLTEEWRTYRHEFVSAETLGDAELSLDLGRPLAAVELGAVTLKSRVWRLTQAPGAGSRIASGCESPDGAVVSTLGAGSATQDVQLIRDQLPFRRDARYRLAFRVRSETPREVGLMVTQAHEPGLGLGPHAMLSVNTEWRTFEREFVCPLEDENGGVYFWLGGADGDVEIADMQLALAADGSQTADTDAELAGGSVSRGRWTLQHRPDRDAQIILSDDRPDAVRVEILKAGTTRWGVDLYQDLGPLEANRRYVLDFLARADRQRTMSLGITQSYEPWAALGLYREVELNDKWQAFRNEFTSTGSDEHARLQFNLGISNAAVEISEVSLKPAQRAVAAYRPNPKLKWLTAGGLTVWAGLMLWAWQRRQRAKPAVTIGRPAHRKRRASVPASE